MGFDAMALQQRFCSFRHDDCPVGAQEADKGTFEPAERHRLGGHDDGLRSTRVAFQIGQPD